MPISIHMPYVIGESFFVLIYYMKNMTKPWTLCIEVWKFCFSMILNCFLHRHRKSVSYLFQPVWYFKVAFHVRRTAVSHPVTVQGNFAFHCGGLLLSKQLCASLSDISVALSSAKGNQKWGGRQIIALDDANCECLTGILAFRNGLCCDWGWKLLGTLQGKACACLQNWTGRSC